MTDGAAAGPACARAGLARVLGAAAYDALALFAILFAATVAILPLTGGQSVRPGHPGYAAYLLAVSFAYFGWCWTRAGQTLGMRAWRLRLRSPRGQPIGWGEALVRFAGALGSWTLLGGGFLWMLVDREGASAHDRLSGTRLVVEPRTPRR